MTLEHCKDCEQCYMRYIVHADDTIEKEYHCRKNCHILIEQVKSNECVKKEKIKRIRKKNSK